MSVRADILNIVTSGTQIWLWVQKPHPFVVQTFGLLGAANQKNTALKGLLAWNTPGHWQQASVSYNLLIIIFFLWLGFINNAVQFTLSSVFLSVENIATVTVFSPKLTSENGYTQQCQAAG